MAKNNSNPYALIVAFIVSVGGLLLGISATIGGANEFYRVYFNLNPFWEGLTVSATMLTTFIGNLFAGSISDKIGRKRALMVAAVLFSVCTLGSAISPNFAFLLITRFIGGLGIGIALVVVPMYIAEFSPSKMRGLLVSFNQLNIGIGYLLAYVFNSLVNNYVDTNYLGDIEMKWRLMLGVGAFIPVLYFILLLLIPKSPRWLITKGKDEAAKRIMAKTGGPEHAEEEYRQIKLNLEKDKQEEGKKIKYRDQWSMLFNRNMRLILIVAFSIAIFQMVSGVNVIFFFGPKIFNLSGASNFMSPFMQANIIGVVMVVMTVVTMFIIDKVGRKPLLYIGVGILTISSFLVGTSFNKATYFLAPEDVKSIVSEIDKSESRDKHNEAVILEQVLMQLANKEYESEVKFFNTLKSNIEVVVREYVDKYSGVSLIDEFAYYKDYFELLNKGYSKEKIIKKIVDKKYNELRNPVLDASITINSLLVLIAIIGVVIGFSISLGPVMWAMLSEIFPAKVRGIGISVASMINGLTSWVVTLIFPIELEKLGSGTTYYIYGAFMILCLFMVFRYYPETKGKTLEEIEKELVKP